MDGRDDDGPEQPLVRLGLVVAVLPRRHQPHGRASQPQFSRGYTSPFRCWGLGVGVGLFVGPRERDDDDWPRNLEQRATSIEQRVNVVGCRPRKSVYGYAVSISPATNRLESSRRIYPVCIRTVEELHVTTLTAFDRFERLAEGASRCCCC